MRTAECVDPPVVIDGDAEGVGDAGDAGGFDPGTGIVESTTEGKEHEKA